jgi:hypothetical protein
MSGGRGHLDPEPGMIIIVEVGLEKGSAICKSEEVDSSESKKREKGRCERLDA